MTTLSSISETYTLYTKGGDEVRKEGARREKQGSNGPS